MTLKISVNVDFEYFIFVDFLKQARRMALRVGLGVASRLSLKTRHAFLYLFKNKKEITHSKKFMLEAITNVRSLE